MTSSNRHSKYPMISMNNALECVLEECESVVHRIVSRSLNECLGFILAEDVVAYENVPPFNASMMDGYAVIASDGVGEYPIITNITAGNFHMDDDIFLQSGQVAYITTGAPLPNGANAVQMIEKTDDPDDAHDDDGSGGARVKILEAVNEGQFVRPCGCDIAEGDVVARKGTRITPAEIGVLSSVNVVSVQVYDKPIVGVLSTGDELTSPGTPQVPGKVRDSNRVMLLCMLREMGCSGVDCGIAADEDQQLSARLRSLLTEVDILVTTGGVSMGTLDLIKPALASMGTLHFGRLCMKPGKPTTFASVDMEERHRLVFALPGNPVSALVSFRLLVEPCVRAISGEDVTTKTAYNRVMAKLLSPVSMDPQRPEFHRVHVCYSEKHGSLVAVSTGVQRSSRLLSTSAANGLMEVPQGRGELAFDSTVSVILIDRLLHESQVQLPSHHHHGHHHHHHHNNNHKGHHHHSHHHGKQHSCHHGNDKDVKFKATHAKGKRMEPRTFNVGLLVVSDRVSSGQEKDGCVGAAVGELVSASTEVNKFVATHEKVIADDIEAIEASLLEWCQPEQQVHVVFTMGGTGFGVRDVTPEATKRVIQREAPGLVIAMIEAGLKILPQAMLARPVAGIRDRTLIVNLPGRPKAVVENMQALFAALPHAIRHIHQSNPSPWGVSHV